MKLDGVTAISVILIASFAIDRTVTGILFALSFFKFWTRIFPDPELLEDPATRKRADKKCRLVYFAIAAFFGILILAHYGNVRLLSNLGFPTDRALDTIVTGLILMGGSDRVAALLKMPGAPGVEKPAPQPIQITGKLTLEETPSKRGAGIAA